MATCGSGRSRPSPSRGGPVYDVVNRKGELVDRVQVPANRSITAFGPGGVVYLTSRDGKTTKLEKATVQ